MADKNSTGPLICMFLSSFPIIKLPTPDCEMYELEPSCFICKSLPSPNEAITLSWQCKSDSDASQCIYWLLVFENK